MVCKTVQSLRPLLWFFGAVLCMCSLGVSPELTLFHSQNWGSPFTDLSKLSLILSNPQCPFSWFLWPESQNSWGFFYCPAHTLWLALPSEWNDKRENKWFPSHLLENKGSVFPGPSNQRHGYFLKFLVAYAATTTVQLTNRAALGVQGPFSQFS